MTDPYVILGVPHNASEKEVKEAYKRLALKYHPEHCDSTQEKIAAEKMAEIDEAYDRIIKDIKLNTNSSGGNGGGYTSVSEYADVRRLISARRLDDAEQILDGVQPHSRNAEWNYLKGYILYQRGWLEEATGYISKAYQSAPFNAEYKKMYDMLIGQKSGFNGGYNPAMGNSDPCSICSTICMADMCCECMGGDLIPCC